MERRMWMETLAAVAVAGALCVSTTAAFAAQDAAANEVPPASTAHHSNEQPGPGWARFQQRRAEFVQQALDRTAARLQIEASQEPQWKDFADAFKALVATAPHPGVVAAMRRDRDNAAALIHLTADNAVNRSQALEHLADAASKLQNTLNPNQRQVFAQMVRARLERYAMRGFPMQAPMQANAGRSWGPRAGWGWGGRQGWDAR